MLDGFAALATVLLKFYLSFNSFFIFTGVIIPHTANGAFQSY